MTGAGALPCTSPPELWGGVECTLNRVGDRFMDQIEWSGHDHRVREDLERLAALDLRALRFPVLWERTAPGPRLEQADWRWADEGLSVLRRLGLPPILGLVHHGSGPRFTNLLDPSFAEGLARFAEEVARRYPWVGAFTPVNEPLTTARFSGLYGHWYPHARDALSFARMLLNQCRAVVHAMRAIRRVRPDARLVQTEDLGVTLSTPLLAYQAEHENERRWLTWDLLCGRVTPGHALYEYLLWLGLHPADLLWFADNPCPPDVIGVNYYITSERFLDEAVDRYPQRCSGGNDIHRYADTEAVRACPEAPVGVDALVRSAAARYGLPLAITETHLGCTREEQMRWLLEVRRTAARLRSDGIDLRAVTAWALLGAYDWDSLVTEVQGHYEPGAFDVRGPHPRATALVPLLRAWAAEQEYDHPVLDAPGWWRRPDRFTVLPAMGQRSPQVTARPSSPSRGRSRPLLIIGVESAVTAALVHACARRAIGCKVLPVNWPAMARILLSRATSFRPWCVIYCVDRGTAAGRGALRGSWTLNARLPAVLARACSKDGIAFAYSSVAFHIRQLEASLEELPAARTRTLPVRLAPEEELIRSALPNALIVRARCPAECLFARAPAEDGNNAASGHLSRIADVCLDLVIDAEQGIWEFHRSAANALLRGCAGLFPHDRSTC